MKHWPFDVRNEGTRPKVEVEYKGEKKRFFPEEVSSMSYIRAFNGGRAITRAHTRPDSTKRAIDRAGKYQTLERSVCCFNNFSSDLF
jgi:hypothetical protein